LDKIRILIVRHCILDEKCREETAIVISVISGGRKGEKEMRKGEKEMKTKRERQTERHSIDKTGNSSSTRNNNKEKEKRVYFSKYCA
jgi:hypothetical protein